MKVQISFKLERAVEAYLNVEIVLLIKIIKWQRGRPKKLSKRLNVRPMITYNKLGTNEGEKHIYKLAETKKMKTRELNGVWCIKDKVLGVLVKEDQGVFVKEELIQERWKSYFNKLFNGNNMKYWSNLSNQMKDRNYRFVRRIRMI